MRLYQVITGSCNKEGSCIAFTSFVGTSFTVYGSGSDLIILNKDLARVQVIQNVAASNKTIVCVACEDSNGRIAATDGQVIAVYEAQAPARNGTADRLSWVRTALIPIKDNEQVKGTVSALAWLPPATLAAAPVLVAGTTCGRLTALEAPLHVGPTKPTFAPSNSEDTPWIWVWNFKATGPVELLKFSPDGRFLASLTRQPAGVSGSSNLLSIWTPTGRRPGPPPVSPATPAGSDRLQPPLPDLFLQLEWNCLPLFHPADVLAFSWRRFTTYLPPGWLPNALLTSCADGVARVWVESLAVEDRYAWTQPPNVDHFSGAEVADGTQQAVTRALPAILMRHPVLRHYLKVWLCHPFNDSDLRLDRTLWKQLFTPPSTFSSAKFTLVASVNAADSNIPVPVLPPDFSPRDSPGCEDYILHWLDNKSLGADEQFTRVLTQFIAELANLPIGDPVSEFSTAKFKVEIGVLDQAFLKFLNSWRRASDTVFMFHPVDGSLFIWAIDGIDRSTLNSSMLSRYAYVVSTTTPQSKTLCETTLMDSGQHVVCQTGVSLRSRIPDVMSRREAMAMTSILSSHLVHDSRTASSRLFIESASAEGNLPQLLCVLLITRAHLANHLSKRSKAAEAPSTHNGKSQLLVKLRKIQLACSGGIPSRHPIALTLTCTHADGALSQWRLGVGDSIDYSGVLSISRSNHINGHRWPLQRLSGHPLLPLLITSSAFRSAETSSAELLLWLSVSASPLSADCRQSATDTCFSASLLDFRPGNNQGLRPIARLTVNSDSAFSSLAWFPCLVSPAVANAHSSSSSDLPISLFVSDLACDQLAVFVALIDAPPALLSLAESHQKASCRQRPVSNVRSGMPGLIMQLSTPLQCRPLCAGESVLLLWVIPRHFVGEWQPHRETDLLSSDEVSSFLVVRLVSMVSGCWTEAWEMNLKPNQQGVLAHQESSLGHLQPCEDISAFDKLIVSVKKVIDEPLPLERGLTVFEAKPGADHIGWAPLATTHIPPPFLLLTVCSDCTLRFWNITEYTSAAGSSKELRWSEWEMALPELSASRISVPSGLLLANLTRKATVDALEERSRNLIGSSPLHTWCNKPMAWILAVACACNGRVAVACCSYSQKNEESEEEPVQIAIFECESSGGCEWMLEDVIIPRYAGGKMPISKQSIQLDWVNTEDGGYLLSIVSLHQLWIYVPMCHDVFLATRCSSAKNPSTLLTTLGEVGLRWVCLRYVCLSLFDEDEETTTEPATTPKTQLALWLSNGLFLSNRTTELHVFSQWPAEVVAERRALVTKLSIAKAPPLGEMADLLKAVDFSASSMGAARLKRNYSDFRLVALDAGRDEAAAGGSRAAESGPTRSDSRKPSHSAAYPKNALDMTLLSDLGLFEAVQLVNPVLPQFHPRQLLEWMNIGRLRRVQALLVHLTCCLSAFDLAYSAGNAGRRTPMTRRPRFHSTSNPDTLSPGDTAAFAASTDEEPEPSRSNTSNLDIQSIPPLPLYVLLELDSLSLNAGNVGCTDTLSDHLPDVDATITHLDNDMTLSLDDLNEPDDPSPEGGEASDGEPALAQWRGSLEEMGYLAGGIPSNPTWNLDRGNLARLLNFGLTQAQILSDLLSRYRLPGLSRLDQMYLLGIAELMANTRSDVTERLSGIAVAPKSMAVRSELQSGPPSADVAGHDLELDECGLRYLLIMQLYSYLCRTLPPAKRTQLLKSGITSRSFVWAFHSDADEILLSFLPSQKQGSSDSLLTWAEFKRYGCGWWIRSDIVLQNCVEKIARSEFMRTKDPMVSAIFYLAMRKNTVLASLFKSQGNRQLEQFFRSDFTPGQPACRQAKLNAFRLMSQHKFQQAAAIFLVGGWLEDAIRVCVDSMNDLQLAVVISRLYSIGQGTSPGASAYHSLLNNYIVPHKDPYLRSIAYWILGEPLEALKTLLQAPTACPQSPEGKSDRGSSTVSLAPSSVEDLPGFEICPSVFKLYTHLRSHPLVTRKLRLLLASAESSASLESHLYQLSVLDRRLYFRTAYHYNAIGCPALALEVLTRLAVGENQADAYDAARRRRFRSMSMARPSATFDLSLDPTVVASGATERDEKKIDGVEEEEDESLGMFFTAPVIAPKDEEFKVTWSDEEEEDPVAPCSDIDTPPPDPPSARRTSLRRRRRDTTTSSQPPADAESTLPPAKPDPILAQLKFIACVRIFTEELCAFASVVSPGGTCLRSKLWLWLEHELNSLRRTTSLQVSCEGQSGDASEVYHCLLSTPPPLYLAEDQPNFVPLIYTRNLGGHFTPIRDQAPSQSVPSSVKQREIQLLKDRLLWLKANMPFIYSLINFCGLQGASGVDLHPVRIELLQLITELFAVPSQSVLPVVPPDSPASSSGTAKTPSSSTICQFLNSVPLLRSAFLIPPGVMYLPRQLFLLKSLVDDISSTLATLPPPFQLCVQVPQAEDQVWRSVLLSSSHLTEDKNNENNAALQQRVLLLRNLCMALSGCAFQCLSTGGWTGEILGGSDAGVAVPASLMTARSVDRLFRPGLPLKPNTDPCNWPGVSGLQSYLSFSPCSAGSGPENGARSTQRLIGILAEVLVSVYVGLAVYALYTRDCSTLYRLISTNLNSAAWSRVFGGVYRVKPVRPVAPPSPRASSRQPGRPSSSPDPHRLTPVMAIRSDLPAQKPPSPKSPSPKPSPTPPGPPRPASPTPTYPDEWFLPPQCSIHSFLLEKPSPEGRSVSDAAFVYDSDVSSVPADYEDFKAALRRRKRRLHRLRRRISSLAAGKSARVGPGANTRPSPRRRSSASSSDDSDDRLKASDEMVLHPGCDLQLLHLNSDFGSHLASTLHPSLGPLGLESAVNALAARQGSTQVGSGNEEDFGVDEDEDLEEQHEGSGMRMTADLDDVFTDCPVSGGNNFPDLPDGDAQWMHGDSYAWRLIRFAFMHLIGQRITELTRMLNLDCEHLATYAPSVPKMLSLIELWKAGYESTMLTPLSHLQQSDLFSGRVGGGGGGADQIPSADKESRYLLPPAHFIPGAEALIGSELEEAGTTPSSPFGRIGLRRFSLSHNPPPLPEAAKRAINRMRYLLNPKHSPFQTHDPFSLPVKRLWFSLLNQPGLGDIFARYIFRQPKVVRPFLPPLTFGDPGSSGPAVADECLHVEPITLKLSSPNSRDRDHVSRQPSESAASDILLSGPSPLQIESSIRLVHKDVEPLLCMCVDRVHYRYIAIGLPKQIIELDITNLLPPATWLMDDLEYDLEAMRNPQLKAYAEGGFDDFILYDKVPELGDFSDRSSVQDGGGGGGSTRRLGSQMLRGLMHGPIQLPEQLLERSRRAVPTVLRRSVPGVQKLSAHPLLPFYLCGTSSGSVHVLEWAASDPIVSTLTNTFALTPQGLAGPLAVGVRGAPVSVLCMDATGKRFGCGDTVGNFGLWSMELSSPNRHPYFNCRAHAKGILDFTFLGGSSTLVATVGAGGSPSAVTSTSSGSAVVVSAPHWSSHRHRGSRGSVGRALAPSELEAASVVLWDVLLPRNRAAVMSFSEPPLDAACSCLADVPNFSLSTTVTSLQTPSGGAYVNADRLLAVGTRRGEVAFLDLRKPAVLFHLTAHDSAVRGILIDKATDTFVTAGADGSVKAWKLSIPKLLATFQSDAQHNRAAASIAAAALFRGNQSAAVVAASKPGISDLLLLPTASFEASGGDPYATSLPLFASRFLSCGVDGCLQLCSIIPRPDPIWLAPN